MLHIIIKPPIIEYYLIKYFDFLLTLSRYLFDLPYFNISYYRFDMIYFYNLNKQHPIGCILFIYNLNILDLFTLSTKYLLEYYKG